MQLPGTSAGSHACSRRLARRSKSMSERESGSEESTDGSLTAEEERGENTNSK